MDDLFDLRWREKIWLPAMATLPILVAYNGVTSIIIPAPLKPIFGDMIELGSLYYIYMLCLAIFCTNSINIYAGINGLEVG